MLYRLSSCCFNGISDRSLAGCCPSVHTQCLCFYGGLKVSTLSHTCHTMLVGSAVYATVSVVTIAIVLLRKTQSIGLVISGIALSMNVGV